MEYLKTLAFLVLLLFPGAQSAASRKEATKKYSYGDLVVAVPSDEVGKKVAAYDAAKDPRQPWELGECLAQPQPQISGRNAITSSYARWPNNTIPYIFKSAHTAFELANIRIAMEQFQNTTCIRFVPRTTEADYISIESQSTGCWSYVGRIYGEQIVNLQSPGCTWDPATAAHELMHAVGFFHEHMRIDRDNYIYVNTSNLDLHAYAGNFYKTTAAAATTLGLPYDYGSVMHYSAMAFSNNSRPVLIALTPGVVLGQADGLTAMDSLKINTFYQCTGPATTTVAPVTAAPTTVAPVTSAPTTATPVTTAPTTVAPVTAAPTSVGPSVTTIRSPVPTFKTCFFTRRPR